MRTPDRVALVTGAAGGLGSAISRRLALEGARLCMVDRVDMAVVRSAIDNGRTACMTAIADVTDANEVNEVVQRCLETFGRIDILVNVAGIVSLGSSDDVTESEWHRVLACNLTSAFLCCKAVLPGMRKQHFGRIVNIGSVLGKNGGNPRPWIDPSEQSRAGSVAYGVSKAGINALTSFLAKENAHCGITVNAVAPGPIATSMTTGFPPALQNLIPVGRMGMPDEVADAVVFLAGDSASFVTGEILDVNGGMWSD